MGKTVPVKKEVSGYECELKRSLDPLGKERGHWGKLLTSPTLSRGAKDSIPKAAASVGKESCIAGP